MTEFERLYGGEFFIIDSFNTNLIEDKFFGYAFQNGEIIQRNNISDEIELDGNGTYIWIKVDDEKISIYQDFNGCYGLYLYKKDNYFAISNSFLKLIDYLKDFNELTFNKEYADAFLFAGLCSFAYEETLINEINLIPRNVTVIIDKITKTINFEKINLKEQSVNIDSEEGMMILDKWFNDWVNLIRSIKYKTNNMSFDLSGGFDSRILAALWLSANIDLNKVFIQSHEDVYHIEDYNIASKIAKDFNFQLNNSDNLRLHRKPFEEINTPLSISFYTKLGFHKEMYFKFDRTEETLFKFTGGGGETIRGYYNEKPSQYMDKLIKKLKNFDESILNSSVSVTQSTWDKLCKQFNIDKNSIDLLEMQYKEIRNRHHFGKANVESYFQNVIILAPALDCNLHKLKLNTDYCKDNQLLMALIFLRYFPDLLNYKISGNRVINEQTLTCAKKINNKFPLNFKIKPFISGPKMGKPINNVYSQSENYVKFDEPDNLLKNIFLSRTFKLEFMKYYSYRSYRQILKTISAKENFPLRHVYSAISILKCIQDSKFNQIGLYDSLDIWLKNFLDSSIETELPIDSLNLLLKYGTARIDIKNFGDEENNIKIINSDDNLNISRPNWLNDDEGNGIVVESIKGRLDLEILCLNKGTLRFWLRGPDVRDKNMNRFPVYIDYTKFSVNDVDYIYNNTLITHDKFFTISKNVNNLEIVRITLEWLPFNSSSNFEG